MKMRHIWLCVALLLCVAALTVPTPSTFAYIVDRANTVNNTFLVEYLPPEDITVPVRVHKTVECLGKKTIGPADFVFLLENTDTGELVKMTSRLDGWATTSLNFSADDVGKTYHYRLSEVNDGREFVTYDDKVYEISISIRLDGQHEMFTAVTVAGVAVTEITAEFVNQYQFVDIPETGDGAQPLLWLAMLVISGAGLVILRQKGRSFRRA